MGRGSGASKRDAWLRTESVRGESAGDYIQCRYVTQRPQSTRWKQGESVISSIISWLAIKNEIIAAREVIHCNFFLSFDAKPISNENFHPTLCTWPYGLPFHTRRLRHCPFHNICFLLSLTVGSNRFITSPSLGAIHATWVQPMPL